MLEKIIERNKMVEVLKKDEDIKLVAVCGSMSKDMKCVDKFSDSDLIIVVSDCAIERFYKDVDSLDAYSPSFACIKQDGENIKTLRICFDNFERFDLMFVKESYFTKENLTNDNPFGNDFEVLYSTDGFVIDIESMKGELPKKEYLPQISDAGFELMANKFWFVAVLAVTKIMRGDYLIGSHLALSLMQETIVLQMNLRDIEKGTTAHRYGDKEKIDIFEAIPFHKTNEMPKLVIDMILKSCEIFEKLVKEISNIYIGRYDKFFAWVIGLEEGQ